MSEHVALANGGTIPISCEAYEEYVKAQINEVAAERDAAQAQSAEWERLWNKATMGLLASQDALGLASEEVRELRAEVARLTEALRGEQHRFDVARRLAERLADRIIHDTPTAETSDWLRTASAELNAALSPASTKSVRITPSGEAVRLSPETEGR